MVLIPYYLNSQDNNPVLDEIIPPQTAYRDPYLRNEWRRVSEREEIYGVIDQLIIENPFLVKKVVYGYSNAGQELIALEIHNQFFSDAYIPTLLLACGIHPREVASYRTGIKVVQSIVQMAKDDSYISFLLCRKKIIYLPIMNPDGLEMLSQGYDWRKNTSYEQGIFNPENAPYSFGVDLNRNFPTHFNYIDGLANITYSGTHPLSEPETASVVNYLTGKNIKTFLSLHSSGRRIVFPWFGIPGHIPDYERHLSTGYELLRFMGNYYVEQGYGYGIYGNMGDYIYSEFGALTYTFELGTSFNCSAEEIQDLSLRVSLALLYLLETM